MTAYYRPMPRRWWLGNRAYFLFMVRELTSVFIALYAVLLLVMVTRIAAGPAAYAAFLSWLASPILVLFHLVALAAALFHTVTWFNATQNVLVVRVGDTRIPGRIIVGTNYAAWVLISIILLWIVIGR